MTTHKQLPFQSCGILFLMSASSLLAQQIVTSPEVPLSPQSDTTVTAAQPKRPAEMVPNAPTVICQGNQLTIHADNSSLRSILAAVHNCIGVEIDLPEAFPDSRAYLQLGPGPARQILDALLSSTDLNYVIQSSNAAPSKIETVVLMARLQDPKEAREATPPAGFALTPARRAWLDSRRNVRPAQPPTEESATNVPESTEATVEATEKVTETPVTPSTASSTPSTTSDASQSAQPAEKSAVNETVETPATAETSVAQASASPAPASDPSQEEPAKKVLQGKIGAMEQLFEQRKQMIANPPAATDPH
jgi:hypothetical protein